MKKESKNKLWIISIFAIAMGFLEAAVVIYLRNLFYTNGFDFPLKGFLNPTVLGVEWVREFATIVMLITIAMLASKKIYERFAYFLYAFAIWDIFYYVFLKLTLNWPSSWFTWDLLFLIPWPWIGPVIAPMLWNVVFITLTVLIINFEDSGRKIKVKTIGGTLFVLGVLITLYTWLCDYGKLIIGGGYAKNFFTLSNNEQFMQIIESYSPSYYNWPLFILGMMISVIAMLLFYVRTKKYNKQ